MIAYNELGSLELVGFQIDCVCLGVLLLILRSIVSFLLLFFLIIYIVEHVLKPQPKSLTWSRELTLERA